MTYEQRYEYVMKRCAEINAQRKKRRVIAAKIVIPISAAAVAAGVFVGFSGHYPFLTDISDSDANNGVSLSATDIGNANPIDDPVVSNSIEEWAKQPHVLPSEFAPEDLDFVNTTNGYPGSHNTTIYADRGSAVYAVDNGKVIFADYDNAWNGGYGSVVVIKHDEGLFTIYCHLLPAEESGEEFVSTGDQVKAGQCIGLAGSSGNIRDYGFSYGFRTELPSFFINKGTSS